MLIYFSGLSGNISEPDLALILEGMGRILLFKLAGQPGGIEGKGFAFVQIETDWPESQLLETLNGRTIRGRWVRASRADDTLCFVLVLSGS